MPDVTVAPSTSDQWPVLAQLALDFKSGDPEPRTEAQMSAFQDLLAGSRDGCVYSISSAGEIIGFAILCWGFSVEYGGKDAFLDEFYIVPEWRNKGIGAIVLEQLDVAARHAGVRALHLEVLPDELRAANLYGRHGFTSRGSLLMSKRLA